MERLWSLNLSAGLQCHLKVLQNINLLFRSTNRSYGSRMSMLYPRSVSSHNEKIIFRWSVETQTTATFIIARARFQTSAQITLRLYRYKQSLWSVSYRPREKYFFISLFSVFPWQKNQNVTNPISTKLLLVWLIPFQKHQLCCQIFWVYQSF